MDYNTIATSLEVWAVIKARHHDELVVFGSYSSPGTGRMETSYGFKGADYPVMEARTTWTVNPEKEYERIDEIHEYWLCLPIEDED